MSRLRTLCLVLAGIVVAVLLLVTGSARADALPALAPDCPACATDAGGARVINIYGEMNGTPPLQWYATDTPPPRRAGPPRQPTISMPSRPRAKRAEHRRRSQSAAG